MSEVAKISMLIFSVLLGLGGVIGFLKAQSKPSLIAGLVSGGLMLISYSMSLRNPQTGSLIGAIIADILLIVFVIRYVKTKKVMPSLIFAVISALESALLWFAAFSGNIG